MDNLQTLYMNFFIRSDNLNRYKKTIIKFIVQFVKHYITKNKYPLIKDTFSLLTSVINCRNTGYISIGLPKLPITDR